LRQLSTGAITDLHSGTELRYESTWTTATLPSGTYWRQYDMHLEAYSKSFMFEYH